MPIGSSRAARWRKKIWRLQQSKAQLAQDVLGEEGFTGSLSKQDFDYLLEDTSDELEPASDGPA